jgi:malate/lactate dehydrogenase
MVLDGEYSCQGLSLGVPAMLGKGGVKQTMNWELVSDEQSELEYCKNVLKAATQVVDAVLR